VKYAVLDSSLGMMILERSISGTQNLVLASTTMDTMCLPIRLDIARVSFLRCFTKLYSDSLIDHDLDGAAFLHLRWFNRGNM